MKEDLNEWNIVLVGQWNPYIFSPSWLCEVLLNIKEIESEFAIGPEISGVRYQTARLILIPHKDRLIIGLKSSEDTSLREAEGIAIKTLELLAHTPIRAAGINFSFLVDHPSPEMLAIFNLADNGKLADADYQPAATEITRDIKLEDTILKLKVALSESGVLKVHLNYHHPIDGNKESAAKAASLIRDKILLYRDRSLSLLQTVYGLAKEGENEPQKVYS